MRLNFEKNEEKNPFLKGKCFTTFGNDQEDQKRSIDLDVLLNNHNKL